MTTRIKYRQALAVLALIAAIVVGASAAAGGWPSSSNRAGIASPDNATGMNLPSRASLEAGPGSSSVGPRVELPTLEASILWGASLFWGSDPVWKMHNNAVNPDALSASLLRQETRDRQSAPDGTVRAQQELNHSGYISWS